MFFFDNCTTFKKSPKMATQSQRASGWICPFSKMSVVIPKKRKRDNQREKGRNSGKW